MDVSVLHKYAQRSPRPGLLVRLLGTGMLERARATSLALLGATAAVGLAIVALALNQDWPLLEGSAIPAAPREEVGRASVVARPAPAPSAHTAADHGQVGRRVDRAAGSAAARPHAVAVAPSGGEEAATLVVSEQAPARPPGGVPKAKAPSTHGAAPAGPSQPTQPAAQQPPATPAASPAPQPAAAPAPAPDPAPAQPEAVASEAPPEESNVPSWSHGDGHAYGRDGEHGGDDHEHGHGWGDGGH